MTKAVQKPQNNQNNNSDNEKNAARQQQEYTVEVDTRTTPIDSPHRYWAMAKSSEGGNEIKMLFGNCVKSRSWIKDSLLEHSRSKRQKKKAAEIKFQLEFKRSAQSLRL